MDDDGDAAEAVLRCARDLIDRQFRTLDGMQLKSGVVLGFVIAAVGVLFGPYTTEPVEHPGLAAFTAVVLLGASLWLAAGLLSRTAVDMHPAAMSGYLDGSPQTPAEVRKSLAADLGRVYVVNEETIKWRAVFSDAGIVLLLVGALSVVLGWGGW